MDQNSSGFCSKTRIYKSLRPPFQFPSQSSITDYTFFLLQSNSSSSPALIDADTRYSVPYSELKLRVRSLAASLQQCLSKGDTAFIISPNSIQIPILYLSLFSIGVIVSPSNPSSTIQEISRQIDLCKPSIAFSTSDSAYKLPSLRYGTIIINSPEFDSMMMSSSPEIKEVEIVQEDPAAVLYSSGTTGKVKGVVLTHRNFISATAVANSSRVVRSSPAVNLCAVPFFHAYGVFYSVRTIALGTSLVLMKRSEFRLMIKAIKDFNVTHLAVAPPVIVSMVNNNDVNLSSLEVVGSGGASISNSVLDRFKNKFPKVSIVQAYGLTETSGGVARISGPKECQVTGSTGKLDPNCSAKIVDPHTGACLPPLQNGELWVKSPNVMKGYVDDEVSTKTVLDSDGWLKTGDLCYFDTNGFLFFVERIKELIKYKGYQVAPAELEHLIESHPDVIEAAVVPYPDEEAGQLPIAFVVRRPNSTIDESQIKEFVAKQVAPYKKIRRVSFISSIPKSATGKVLKKELIKLAFSRL